MSEEFIKPLFVENNYDDVFLIQNQLGIESKIKFKLIHVAYLEKAITRLEEESFDVILLALLKRELNQATEKGIEMIVLDMRNSTLTSQQSLKLFKSYDEMTRNLGIQLFIIQA